MEEPVKVLPWQLSTVKLNGIAAVTIDLTFRLREWITCLHAGICVTWAWNWKSSYDHSSTRCVCICNICNLRLVPEIGNWKFCQQSNERDTMAVLYSRAGRKCNLDKLSWRFDFESVSLVCARTCGTLFWNYEKRNYNIWNMRLA